MCVFVCMFVQMYVWWMQGLEKCCGVKAVFTFYLFSNGDVETLPETCNLRVILWAVHSPPVECCANWGQDSPLSWSEEGDNDWGWKNTMTLALCNDIV